MPGRKTCANAAVSLRNRSCTTSRSSAESAALTCAGVRVGLGEVLALDEQPRKVPSIAASNMLGMRRPGSGSIVVPHRSSKIARTAGVGDVPVAGQLVRERAHVARALHVVLTAQRVDADAVAADVAGDHRQVGHAHDHGRALAVLGDAEAVVDGRVRPGRVQPGRRAQVGRRDAGDRLGGLRAVLRAADELRPARRSRPARTAPRRTSRSTRPSVTTTCAIALTTATLVPGCSCRWWSALDVRACGPGRSGAGRRR